MATSGSQLTRSGPAPSTGGKLASGGAEILHTTHLIWGSDSPRMKYEGVNLCIWFSYKTSSVFTNDKLTRQTFPHVNHPSFLDHPDGQAVRTWLSSEYWCWWPCVRRVRQQTGCTGWGGGGGMQRMTPMQILEINCITGFLLFWGSILNANIALQIYSQRLLLKNFNIYGPII